jgi:hypothetical protein
MSLPSLVIVGCLAQAHPLSWSCRRTTDVGVHTVTLTSSGDDPATLRDMYADAEVIAQAARRLMDRSSCSLIRGGVPTTQGLSGEECPTHCLSRAFNSGPVVAAIP